jgi:O-antigen ligase
VIRGLDGALVAGIEDHSREGSVISGLLAFATFCLVPFLGGNHLALFYVNIDRFWIDGLFAFLLILSLTALRLEGKGSPRAFLGFAKYFLPLLILHGIGVFYSWNRFNAILSLETLIWAAGAVYLYLLVPRKEICLAGLVAGAAGCGISAALQHLMLFPNLTGVFQQGMYAHVLREQSSIPFSSYLHHNMLGGYLAFLFPLALYFVIAGRGVIRNSAAVAASGLIVTGAVLSSSRISLALLVLCLAFALLMVLFERNKAGAIKLCAVAGLALIITFTLLHEGGNKRGGGVQDIIASKAKSATKDFSTLNTRTDIWKNGLKALSHAPVFGFGPGAFEYGYRKYFDGGSYTTVAHSVIVKTLVETGAVGLFCFFFYLFGFCRAVRSAGAGLLDFFLLITACCGFLFSLVDFSFDVTSHVITFFVLTSHFFGEGGSREMTAASSVRGGRVMGPAVFGVIMLTLLGSFLFHNKVDMMKRDMEQGDLFKENSFPVKALIAYRDAMESMPLSEEPYLRAVSLLTSMTADKKNEGNRKEMEEELRGYIRSLDNGHDRNGEKYFVLGQAYAGLGERGKGDDYFRTAQLLYPASPLYAFETGAFYFSNGELDKAAARIREFGPYVPKFRTPHNPRGIFIYKIHDLEASIEFAKGNREGALRIARDNLKDGKEEVYVITSSRSRRYVAREDFLRYLEERVRFYENN